MTVLQRVVTRIENLKELDTLAHPLADQARKATAPSPVKNALSGTWLGHQLHPVLTDLPIGAWVMAGALDLMAPRSGVKAARRLVGFGILAALPTAAAGASDWSDTDGPEQRVGLVHALANVASLVLQAASYLARRRGQRTKGVAFSMTALGATVSASYLGGHLVYNRGVGVSHAAFQEPVTEWTDVASLSELQTDNPTRVMAGTVPVVLVRRGEHVYALSATCVHAGGPLDEGQLVDGCLRCPWHSSTYRLTDGSVERGPAAINQPAWDVQVETGRVSVRTRPAVPG